MKRLVGLAQLEDRQLEELRELLAANAVELRETPPGLFVSGAIWVAEQDHARARELLARESATFAARAREEWTHEWEEVHRGSWARWWLARLRANPGEMILAALALLVLAGLCVVLPATYIARHLP